MTRHLLENPRGIRAETVRFEVLDRNLEVVDQLHPSRESPPTVSLDPTRAKARQMDGLILPERELAKISVYEHRIRPVWVLEDGDEHPMGVFVFDEGSQAVGPGNFFAGTLVDLSATLDAELDETVSYDAETLITEALADRAANAGVASVRIASSSKKLGAPVVWPIGNATDRIIMAGLCALGAFHAPFFDRVGTLVAEPPADATVPTLVIDNQVHAGSIVKADPFMLGAANRYRVVDTSGEATVVVGYYDVPDTAPHSFANTGRRKVERIDLQGVPATPGAAAEAAEAAYRQRLSQLGDVTLTTTPDPRHDQNVVLGWQGNSYTSSWSQVMTAGGDMRHELRRLWL